MPFNWISGSRMSQSEPPAAKSSSQIDSKVLTGSPYSKRLKRHGPPQQPRPVGMGREDPSLQGSMRHGGNGTIGRTSSDVTWRRRKSSSHEPVVEGPGGGINDFRVIRLS